MTDEFDPSSPIFLRNGTWKCLLRLGLTVELELEFATKKSHFLFDDQYYDQIDGVAMDSPLGPVLANIFLCHFEERWVTKGQIRPSLWYRYVDDTFTMFESKDTANEFLRYLNSRHESIKFTIDFEQDNEILKKRAFQQWLLRPRYCHGLYATWIL